MTQTKRKKYGRLTEDLINKAVKLHYEDLVPLSRIAEELGVSVSGLATAFRARGIESLKHKLLRHMNAAQISEAKALYSQGLSAAAIGRKYGVRRHVVDYHLKKAGVEKRKGGHTLARLNQAEAEAAGQMYQRGENARAIGRALGCSAKSVYSALERIGIKRRPPNRGADNVSLALEGSGRFKDNRPVFFYLCRIQKETGFLKAGITHDMPYRRRCARGHYGEQLLLIEYASRREAFFLEQAVLAATKASANCPQALWDERWGGCSEVRQMPADELLSIAQQLADELEELGEWEFAVRYVPMPEAVRLIYRERADLLAAA